MAVAGWHHSTLDHDPATEGTEEGCAHAVALGSDAELAQRPLGNLRAGPVGVPTRGGCSDVEPPPGSFHARLRGITFAVAVCDGGSYVAMPRPGVSQARCRASRRASPYASFQWSRSARTRAFSASAS